MVKTKSIGEKIFTAFNVIFLLLISFACLLPLWHTVAASFSDAGRLMGHQGVVFFPLGFSLDGYKMVMSNNRIWTGYYNTIIYVLFSTLLGLALTVSSAFALSRKRFMPRNVFMFFLFLTMVFSGGLIPFYMVVDNLGLINTRLSLIIPGCTNVFFIVIMRTAMVEIPDSLEESARIDGAGNMRILVSIMVPLCKSTIAVIVLFMAVGQWNSWFNASIFLQDRKFYPLQLVLRDILLKADMAGMSRDDVQTQLQTAKELVKYATTVVATAPILCVYPFVQKHFVKGVLIGSVKG